MSAFFSVLLLIAVPIIIGFWILKLAGWDGEITCDKSECDSCPFPRCDQQNRE